MSKYHVNPATGNAGPCNAIHGHCPFGDSEHHYETAEDARAAFEKDMASAPARNLSKRKQRAIEEFHNDWASLGYTVEEEMTERDYQFVDPSWKRHNSFFDGHRDQVTPYTTLYSYSPQMKHAALNFYGELRLDHNDGHIYSIAELRVNTGSFDRRAFLKSYKIDDLGTNIDDALVAADAIATETLANARTVDQGKELEFTPDKINGKWATGTRYSQNREYEPLPFRDNRDKVRRELAFGLDEQKRYLERIAEIEAAPSEISRKLAAAGYES